MTEDEDTAFALQLDSSACVLDDRAYHGGLISSSAPVIIKSCLVH